MIRGILLACFVSGCVTGKPDIAPPPFDAAQIRDATRPGRTYRFEIRAANEPELQREIVFETVTDAGARMKGTMFDADGAVLSRAPAREVTWAELVGHASYPVDETVITQTSIEVPAGTFDAVLYTVTSMKDGVSTVTRAWFATSLPGAPVRHEVETGGVVVQTMLLLKHSPGK